MTIGMCSIWKHGWRVSLAAAVLILAVAEKKARAQATGVNPFSIHPLRIPMREAGPNGLEALVVQPNEPGPHPLAVWTHGSVGRINERRVTTPQRLLPIALEFARRGWITAIVMRRNYGLSGGRLSDTYSAAMLQITCRQLRNRPGPALRQ
jgi:hypothetical protein